MSASVLPNLLVIVSDTFRRDHLGADPHPGRFRRVVRTLRPEARPARADQRLGVQLPDGARPDAACDPFSGAPGDTGGVLAPRRMALRNLSQGDPASMTKYPRRWTQKEAG